MTRATAVLFFCSVLLLRAQTPEAIMTETATQLAARISSLLPHPSQSQPALVLLETQNLTPVPTAEWSRFRNLLVDQLRSLGIGTAGTPPESRVKVTLAESSHGLLVIAEVAAGDQRQVAILPWNLPASNQSKPQVTITQKIVWKQADPILDLLISDSAMLVLSTNSITSFRLMDNKWVPSATASLVLPRPMPRDPRGRLEGNESGFRAHLPGATCQGAWVPDLKISCSSGNTEWAGMRWQADRNLLQSPAVKTPFYSTGAGLFVLEDGQVHDAAGQPVAGTDGWGSDSAGVIDPCNQSPGVIAVNTSSDARDEVRVFDVEKSLARQVSEPLALTGPATAIWPIESQRAATLVVRNLQTGEYEASRLLLACNQ